MRKWPHVKSWQQDGDVGERRRLPRVHTIAEAEALGRAIVEAKRRRREALAVLQEMQERQRERKQE